MMALPLVNMNASQKFLKRDILFLFKMLLWLILVLILEKERRMMR